MGAETVDAETVDTETFDNETVRTEAIVAIGSAISNSGNEQLQRWGNPTIVYRCVNQDASINRYTNEPFSVGQMSIKKHHP